MRHLYLLLVLVSINLSAQQYYKVAPTPEESLPTWATLMYSDNPNVWQVDDMYRIWRQSNQEAKTTYTQYYKKWRRANEVFVNREGFIQKRTEGEEKEFRERIESLKASGDARKFYERSEARPPAGRRSMGEWTVLGPVETFNTNTGPNPLAKSSQVNVYCFDQSNSHPNVMYCGTEGGDIYKSTDKGAHWFPVSREYAMGAPHAMEVHPSNPDIVFAGENDRLRRSIDGGETWEIVHQDNNMSTNDIQVNPMHDSLVLAATQNGLYRSDDSGSSWTRLLDQVCYDIEWKADDPLVAFLVRNDPALGICRFYKSINGGLTWEVKDNGWFFSDEEGRADGGAKLAVTNADPNRIYAVLIGEARTGDAGFIGIWRSDDAGETWTLPNGPAGGPWDEVNHPNMAGIGQTGGYHQGFYNLGFDASDTNPDFLMAGFMNLWYSNDGAATFTCFGGYCGNPYSYVHPDCQEIEINGDEIWMTSDGGIEYSNDFFETHEARNRGITSSDYWGFATGWNEDILVGGRYHNGNSAWHENWMPGECLSLGGGEAATGYVNPGEGRKTYFSDLGQVILPEMQNGYAEYFGFGKFPNESYYDAESGEMEWDPVSWNTFYLTNENKLWRTRDGGASWHVLYEFGTDVNARTMSFEISRSNSQVMYVFQRDEYSWDPGLLWKTINGGETWNLLTFPPGYARRGLLAVDAEDAQRVWLAYPDGGDGERIYTSFNGGESWENITTPALNGEHIQYIMHQGGTDGGIYLGTYRTIWFKDDTMPEWMPYDEGLPVQISTCILRPFYRDHKIRLGAYGKGIWEAPFAVESKPIAQPMISKTSTTCPGDTIRFDDFSMLSHEGATWEWQFPGGIPATSGLRNPKVIYHEAGAYDVTLTVTNPFGTSTKTIENMIEILEPIINDVPPQIIFTGDQEYYTIVNPDDNLTWEPIDLVTCDEEGNTAMFVNNYIYSSYGVDEILLPVNLDLTQYADPVLRFRVAYAPYFDGNFFIDSLKVLITNNCGSTYKVIFRGGGADLSTTTSGLGPDSLYEYDAFTPQSCEEWRDVEIDLSEYAGQYVTIRFVNHSGYGNNMYLDDILLEETVVSGVVDQIDAHMHLQPNPAADQVQITGDGESGDAFTLTLQSSTGVTLMSKNVIASGEKWTETISLAAYPSGFYVVMITDQSGRRSTEKLVKL